MRIFVFDPPTSVAFRVPGVRIQLTDVSSGFGKLKSGFQLTDAGDFGRPRSQDFNLPTSVTLGGVLVGLYTII